MRSYQPMLAPLCVTSLESGPHYIIHTDMFISLFYSGAHFLVMLHTGITTTTFGSWSEQLGPALDGRSYSLALVHMYWSTNLSTCVPKLLPYHKEEANVLLPGADPQNQKPNTRTRSPEEPPATPPRSLPRLTSKKSRWRRKAPSSTGWRRSGRSPGPKPERSSVREACGQRRTRRRTDETDEHH